MSRFLVATCLMLPIASLAGSLQCMLGVTRCIKSQGTEIPSMQVIELLDRCSDFTNKDLGRLALKLSHKELRDQSAGKITPLVRAWHAFDDLYDSPLAFERKKKAEETNY